MGRVSAKVAGPKIKLNGMALVRRMCRCGHHRDYHIGGTLKCLFGICDCKGFHTSGGSD